MKSICFYSLNIKMLKVSKFYNTDYNFLKSFQIFLFIKSQNLQFLSDLFLKTIYRLFLFVLH